MPRLRTFGFSLSILLALPSLAQADPFLNGVAAYSDSLGLSTTTPVPLPDLTTGGSVVLGSLPIVGPTTPSNPPTSTPINGTFNLQIGWSDAASPIPGSLPGIFPLLTTGGTLTGSVDGPSSGSPSYSGGYIGGSGGDSDSLGLPENSTIIPNSMNCGSMPSAFIFMDK